MSCRDRLPARPRQRLPLRNYLSQFASVVASYAVFFRSVFSAPPHAMT
jgi:hypothetical protein